MNEKLLTKIGLNKYESSVYLTLLKQESMEASKLSHASKVPVGKIYEVLKALKNYELVEIQPSRPQRYRAVDPKRAFKLMYKRKEEETLNELKMLRETFDEIERELCSDNFPQNIETIFWPDKFRNNEVNEMVDSYFEKIEHEVCVVIHTKYKPGRSELYDASVPAFSKAFFSLVQRGIKVKILDPGSQLLLSLKELIDSIEDLSFKRYIKVLMEVRILETEYNFTIIDSKITLIDIEDQFNMSRNLGMTRIYDESYAKRFKTKFDELWKKGELFL
ncbi:TrmB family transcriptional regulator [Methanosarcina hadiensis]|uniref:TrmB family transcriptional regulator n=1 Tax=Methanosarcina hadiensis TaxID=3078083 RepID=UPI0039776761